MEQLYIREKNNVHSRLKELALYTERNEAALKTISGRGVLTDFDRGRQAKLLAEIDAFELEKSGLETRLDDLVHKKLDVELLASSESVKVPVSKKPVRLKIEAPKFQPRQYDPSYVSERQIERETSRFMSAPFPERLDLSRLPNNRGYIWNGIWYFGVLSAEPGKPISVQEKVRNSDITRTIEADSEYRCVYEKRGKSGHRVLVSKEPRSKFHKDMMLRVSFGLL